MSKLKDIFGASIILCCIFFYPYELAITQIAADQLTLASTKYTASATESIRPSIDLINTSQDLEPNVLTRIQTICHGAPIRSVAWLCVACPQPILQSGTDNYFQPRPIAAAGGFISHTRHPEGSSFQVYDMDLLTEQLTEKAHAAPTDYVFSVDWCCIDGIAYLAVGGVPNATSCHDVWIYKYDVESSQLTEVVSFRHGAPVNAVAWLCDDCMQPGIRYLAVGGQAVNDINIRLLRFDANCTELSLITCRSFGAPVLSLDWCVIDGKMPLLLVGGKTAVSDSQKYNIRVYCGNCTGALNLAGSFYYQGKTVRSAKWCCDADKKCSQLPVFAVGGNYIEHTARGKSQCENIQLFVYSPLCNQIRSLAYQHLPEKVFALDWIPGCHCTRLTAGSGCLDDCMCQQNIAVFQILPEQCTKLVEISNALFDDTISSLKWCEFGPSIYLLVGTEHKGWQECPPQKQICNGACEIALYKARFCHEHIAPECICDRRSRAWSIEDEE